MGHMVRVLDNLSTEYAKNIAGPVSMMEAAAKNGVKKFTYASSAAVYGDDETMPKREEIVGNRLSTYAVTKFVDEEYAYQYTLNYGLDCYGMRYFNVYGRRQDPNGAYAVVIPKFIECLLRDDSPTINGDGEQSRDFVYVEDVVQVNLLESHRMRWLARRIMLRRARDRA